MHACLSLLAKTLRSFGQPFSFSLDELAKRDNEFRWIFACLDRLFCCNGNPFKDLPHEKDFLLTQLLILSPEEQTPFQEQDFAIKPASTCEVCFDQDAEQLRLTEECVHEGGVCLQCLAQAITAQLDLKRWNELTCPLCPAKLDSNAVEKYAPGETVQRYLMYSSSLFGPLTVLKVPNVHG